MTRGNTSTDGIEIEESNQLIASDKVEGTAVYDPSGERLGTIHNFMVDKLTGQTAYAVMSFGGFLGVGERYHPLPWESLEYDTELGGYVVSLNRSRLEDAPSFGLEEDPWGDPSYSRGVSEYWDRGDMSR